jgi:predicted RecB family nuclease
VGPAREADLFQAGIKTLRDLTKAKDLRRIARKSGLSENYLRILQLRAESLLERRAYQVRPFALPEENPVFFDIETDRNCARVWLVGIMDGDEFSRFYADGWRDEKRILKDFIHFLAENPERRLVSYSGTNFDRNVLQRALRRLNMDSEFFSSYPHTDFCQVLRRSFIFPTEGYGLKVLGRHLGYPFKYPEIDGRFVAEAYEQHIKEKKRLSPRFLRYNEDDVKAIPFIAKKAVSAKNMKKLF